MAILSYAKRTAGIFKKKLTAAAAGGFKSPVKMNSTRVFKVEVGSSGQCGDLIFSKPKQIGTTNFYTQTIWDCKTKKGFLCVLSKDEHGEFEPASQLPPPM